MNEGFFKGWFVFVAFVSVCVMGLSAWAIVTLVNWITSLG